jgi:putative phosphoesterase
MSPARRAAARRLPPNVHRSEVVELPEGEDVVVAVVADTHGHPHPAAPELIRALGPRLIVHAGDIGDLEALTPLRAIAPLLAVRGNIDGAAPGFADSLDIELRAGARCLVKLLLTHIAVYGPRLRPEVAQLAEEHQARIVLCGHSHVPFLGKSKGLVMFNPGSIGPRRFQLPITFGELAIRSSGISLRHVSCETGQTWLP